MLHVFLSLKCNTYLDVILDKTRVAAIKKVLLIIKQKHCRYELIGKYQTQANPMKNYRENIDCLL